MLTQDQASELLRRCELIVKKPLKQIEGNLKNAETRASAVWELLVIEEVSKLGKIEYEPISEQKCPDIRLTLSNQKKIWIEIAFLHPRFWKEENKTVAITRWIREKAKMLGISPYKISFAFDGSKNDAGRKRELPNLHEKKKFLEESTVVSFFEKIRSDPSQKYSIQHEKYSIQFIYLPDENGPFLGHSGLVQEVPQTLKENALYRLLEKKRKQHNTIEGTKLICIGADESPVVFNSNNEIEKLVCHFFRNTTSISGVLIFKIPTFSLNGIPKGILYKNNNADEKLTKDDWSELQKINFNRWKYSTSLNQSKNKDNNIEKQVTGSLTTEVGINKISLSIPSSIIVNTLIGKTNLIEEYFNDPLTNKIDDNNTAYKYLNEGWIITSCSWKKGNIEKGEDSQVILELSLPPESVYGLSNKKK